MEKMVMENYLFILWNKARKHQDAILADMHTRFNHVKIYEITWSQQYMESNFSRFFEKRIDTAKIEKNYGVEPFMLCVVVGEHEDVKSALVCYNKMIGDTNPVYAASSEKQANRDVALMLGKNMSDLAHAKEFYTNSIEHIEKDLEGANGWNSLAQIFYVLNNSIRYVVLRNYESYPDNFDPTIHGDVDLLVENLHAVVNLTNSKKMFPDKPTSVAYYTPLKEGEMQFDFRHVGDNYLDVNWESDILRSARFLSPPPILDKVL